MGARQPAVDVAGHGREWRRVAAGLLVSIGGATGLLAEAASFGFDDPTRWAPDLAVGWMAVGCGVIVWTRRPNSRIGPILTGTGFTWFIGNFAGVPIAIVASLAGWLTLLHRALLAHAVLTVPDGRVASRAQLTVIAAGYVAWGLGTMADAPIVAVALSGLLIAAAGREVMTAAAPARRIRLVAFAAALILAAAFGLASVAHATITSGEADAVVLLVNEAAIIAAIAAVTVATLLPNLQAAQVTDLVVDATRSRSGIVRTALANALGDPSLEIGYWHAGSRQYLDASGETVTLPGKDDERTVLRVDLDERPAGVLVHDRAALESSAVADAVRATTVLAAANARLRGDVLDQLGEVRASRRRLLLAADAELARLGRRVDEGPLERSRRLAADLAGLAAAADSRGEDELAAQVRSTQATLARATAELGELAQGLHPASVAANGLAAALRSLAERSTVPVDIRCEVGRLPDSVVSAIYYAAAEALANVAKHSLASAARVSAWDDGVRAFLFVSDDGRGGASLDAGTGLRGIVDRIEALDGTVQIETGPGSGTRLSVAVPLSHEAGSNR